MITFFGFPPGVFAGVFLGDLFGVGGALMAIFLRLFEADSARRDLLSGEGVLAERQSLRSSSETLEGMAPAVALWGLASG